MLTNHYSISVLLAFTIIALTKQEKQQCQCRRSCRRVCCWNLWSSVVAVLTVLLRRRACRVQLLQGSLTVRLAGGWISFKPFSIEDFLTLICFVENFGLTPKYNHLNPSLGSSSCSSERGIQRAEAADRIRGCFWRRSSQIFCHKVALSNGIMSQYEWFSWAIIRARIVDKPRKEWNGSFNKCE